MGVAVVGVAVAVVVSSFIRRGRRAGGVMFRITVVELGARWPDVLRPPFFCGVEGHVVFGASFVETR